MQSSKLLGLLLPPLFILACGSTALLDGTDDMRQPGATGSGQTEGSCSACFDTSCSWQSSQCEGDPACARWLTDARLCPADDFLRPKQSCLAQLTPPDSPNGKLTSDALRSCLSSANACCSGPSTGSVKGDAGSGAAGSAGAGGPTDGNGGNESLDAGYSGNSPDGTTSPVDGGVTDAFSSCEACIYSFKHDAQDLTCGKAARDCWDNSAPPTSSAPGQCREFMLGYFSCFSSASSLPSVPVSGDCLLKHALEVTPEAQVQFMSSVLSCAYSRCKDSCLPDAGRACMTCQNGACPDVIEAYLNDADAQKLMWCREAANGNVDKIKVCDGTYGAAGAKVLKEVAACSSANCPVCK